MSLIGQLFKLTTFVDNLNMNTFSNLNLNYNIIMNGLIILIVVIIFWIVWWYLFVPLDWTKVSIFI